MIILFLLFITGFIESIAPNHQIALNKYAQGKSYSNLSKEYLENAAVIVDDAIKKADSEKDPENQEKEPVFDSESFDEFDFISKNGEGLFFPKNVQLSHAGAAFVAYLATGQTTDRTVLEKRSALFSYLEKNPEFKAQLIKVMRELKPEMEESFLELGWPVTEKEKEQQNDFFFNRSNLILPDFIAKRLIPQKFVNWSADYFSNHPYVFNFLNIVHKPILYSLVSSLLFFWARAKKARFWKYETTFREEKNRLLNLSRMAVFLKGAVEYKKLLNFGMGCLNFPLGQKISMFLMFETMLWVLPVYCLFKATKDYYKSFIKQERYLISAQKAVQISRALDQLLAKHPEFSKHLLLAESLKIPSQKMDGNAQFFLNTINNNRIQSTSFLNYALWGTRIAVNKILVDNPDIARQKLFPILAGFGELDAYCALSGQFEKYSVPQFVDKGVGITLTQFFHPNLRNPVCNDLDLAKTHKRKVFVSGGNGSGKSAITRSAIASIVAAQTFNRISAQSAKIPLFDKIAIFANLSDNLGVASKFQIELGKLKKVQKYLEQNPNKKVLLMLDEPLTSINTELVGKILLDLFVLFSKYHNLIIFCVSNTPGLKDFKDTVHMGTCVDTNFDGTFKPTYQWKEGSAYVSDVWFQFRKIFGEDFGASPA